MKRILVPLDFSETSENAFVYALEMAKVYKAKLVLLHTFELPIVDNQVIPVNYAEMYDNLEKSNATQLKEEIKKLKLMAKESEGATIDISHILMNGDLIDCIKKVVHQEAIDFVVMGTNGASGWLETFIGTNTGSVISDLNVPVLSVAHDTKFHKMETIGFRTRYKDDEIPALNEVLSFARKIGAKVKCLYVKTPDAAHRGEAITYWETVFADEKDLEFFIIPSENIEGTIEDFIAEQHIDLFAMVFHRKNFFTRLFTTSTTEKMSQHSKTPILALHE